MKEGAAVAADMPRAAPQTTFVIERRSGWGFVDWKEIWRTIEAVTPEEWEASKGRLKASYQAIRTLTTGFTWDSGDEIGGTMAILVHTAYHLGEIRQALCTLK